MQTNSAHLMLMAKAPLPGRVKTRLAQQCGNACAAEIAAELVALTVARCAQVWSRNVTLCVDGSGHEFIEQLSMRYGLEVIEQTSGDLGQRMLAALRHGLTRADSAAVMGCDVPHCPVETLAEAQRLMQRGNNVVGSCTDGGFYFFGVNQISEEIFKNIRWSSPVTLQQTRDRCAEAGVEFHSELPMLRDIDYWEDLVVAAQTEPSLIRFMSQEKLPA